MAVISSWIEVEPVTDVGGVSLEEVLDEIRRRRDEFRQLGYVPKDFVHRLKQLGIYRAATPRRFGGDALPPSEFMKKIEQISAVDPSVGWVASFGSALVYLAALPLDTQAELYRKTPDVVFAGGLFPVQKAEECEEGLRVSGQWQFASGCAGADALGIGLAGDSSSEGRPLTGVLDPSRVEIIPNWDVAGMKATGSNVLKVDHQVIPREWTFIRGGEATVDEPLYRYPTIAYAAQVLAVVNLGAARAALDYAIEQGSGVAGITGAPKLGDRPYYRADVAQAEAKLRSARAFFYEVSDEVYATVEAGGLPTDRQRALLRLTAAHAAEVGKQVVQEVYAISGTGAIYTDHPLQRFVQDSLVPPQHAFLGRGMYDAAGAVLMGMKPTVPGFF
jgi:alkylation response protein AidB-like acyl-CoA dehydrogenase